MIGQRLKLARAAAGVSLRGLEDGIGKRVTAQAIGKYERDQSMPSSGVLIALADALDVSVDYLVGDRGMVLEAVEFGKRKIANKRAEAKVEAKILHLLEPYLMLEELLDLQSVEWDEPREAPYPVNREVSEADRAARSLRRHWGLGSAPIPNLVEILEERGIKILAIDLANIDGLTARVRRPRMGAVPVIVVNRKDRGERQRFTLAHELGRMVMDVDADVDEEKAAHRFAGAFLMPADALRAEIGRHRTSIGGRELFHLKRLFGVSVQVIAHRCKDLGIFNRSLFQRLFREFDRLGWRRPPYEEPHTMRVGEEPTRFERLTFRALAEGAISEPKAAELLGLTVRELNRHMEIGPPVEPARMEARCRCG